MELKDFLDCMNGGHAVIAGSEMHQYMHFLSQEALKVTGHALRLIEQVAELNHTVIGGAFLTGRAEALFARQTNLLRQPADFLLQGGNLGIEALVFRFGNRDHFHAAQAHLPAVFLEEIITEKGLKNKETQGFSPLFTAMNRRCF